MNDFFTTNTSMNVPLEKKERVLVWHEEFEDANIDFNKWNMHRTMNSVGNIYENTHKNIRVENNNLHMQIHRCGDTFSLCEGLTTLDRMFFKYGYLEMRAKIPFRHCAWPSFWLLGNTKLHNKNIGWFAEIDIFEVFSSEDTLSSNLHKWDACGHEMLPGEENNKERGYKFADTKTLNDEYHIYGYEWDEHEVKFYVDNECYYSVPIDKRSDFVSELFPSLDGFHEPLYISLNNEIFTEKSDWLPEGSAATADDLIPIDYYVDYIRLYQNPEKEEIYLKEDIEKAENK